MAKKDKKHRALKEGPEIGTTRMRSATCKVKGQNEKMGLVTKMSWTHKENRNGKKEKRGTTNKWEAAPTVPLFKTSPTRNSSQIVVEKNCRKGENALGLFFPLSLPHLVNNLRGQGVLDPKTDVLKTCGWGGWERRNGELRHDMVHWAIGESRGITWGGRSEFC